MVYLRNRCASKGDEGAANALPDCLQICTNEDVICAININTMKKEDAHFTSDFTLVATRNDFIHALVRLKLPITRPA